MADQCINWIFLHFTTFFCESNFFLVLFLCVFGLLFFVRLFAEKNIKLINYILIRITEQSIVLWNSRKVYTFFSARFRRNLDIPSRLKSVSFCVIWHSWQWIKLENLFFLSGSNSEENCVKAMALPLENSQRTRPPLCSVFFNSFFSALSYQNKNEKKNVFKTNKIVSSCRTQSHCVFFSSLFLSQAFEMEIVKLN